MSKGSGAISGRAATASKSASKDLSHMTFEEKKARYNEIRNLYDPSSDQEKQRIRMSALSDELGEKLNLSEIKYFKRPLGGGFYRYETEHFSIDASVDWNNHVMNIKTASDLFGLGQLSRVDGIPISIKDSELKRIMRDEIMKLK